MGDKRKPLKKKKETGKVAETTGAMKPAPAAAPPKKS